MKARVFLILAITVISTFFSCKKIDKLLTFTISEQSSFKIKSSLPFTLPIEIFLPDIKTNSSQEFQNNNTKTDLVKDIRLKELKLTITNPIDKTFSFLKSIHIYISTDENDEIELAYLNDISSTANSIMLIPSTEKLDKYVKSSSYKLRTTTTIRETLSQDVDIQIDLKFKITADPL